MKIVLAGCNFVEGFASKRASMKKGLPLKLVREPENKHDPFAISVRNEAGEHLGYIPARMNQRLTDELDVGFPEHSVTVSEADAGYGALAIELRSSKDRSTESGVVLLTKFQRECAREGFSEKEFQILSTLSFPQIRSPHLRKESPDKGWSWTYGEFPQIDESRNICNAPSIPDFILKQLLDERLISCESSRIPKMVDVEDILRDNKMYVIKRGLIKDESHPAIRMVTLVSSLGYLPKYYDPETTKIKKKTFSDFLRVSPESKADRKFPTIDEWHIETLEYGRLHFKTIFEGLSRFFLPFWKYDDGGTLLEWYNSRTLSEIVAFEHLMAAYLVRIEKLLTQISERKEIDALADELIRKEYAGKPVSPAFLKAGLDFVPRETAQDSLSENEETGGQKPANEV